MQLCTDVHSSSQAASGHDLQAWIFAAIDDEAQAAKYYAYAAVYALPLLRNGFTIDSFLVAAVLLCAAHVQVMMTIFAKNCFCLVSNSRNNFCR